MSESPQPRAGDEPANPTEDELDVEGPNESAPGHEPVDEDGEAAEPSSPPSE
jgi:hypothetical protein